MKSKTAKLIRKIVQKYRINFGFIEPYSIILDGNFIKKCMDKSFEFRKKIQKYLSSRLMIQTTTCVIRELNQLGLKEAFEVAKQMKQIKCKHEPPLSPCDCFQQLIGENNDQKYMIATQDQSLKKCLQKKKGVPLFHFDQEKFSMSDLSFKYKDEQIENEYQKQFPNKKEMTAIKQVKHENLLKQKMEKAKQKKQIEKENFMLKKRYAKGPNPLSIKKKVHLSQEIIINNNEQKKKKRCRSKKPE